MRAQYGGESGRILHIEGRLEDIIFVLLEILGVRDDYYKPGCRHLQVHTQCWSFEVDKGYVTGLILYYVSGGRNLSTLGYLELFIP